MCRAKVSRTVTQVGHRAPPPLPFKADLRAPEVPLNPNHEAMSLVLLPWEYMVGLQFSADTHLCLKLSYQLNDITKPPVYLMFKEVHTALNTYTRINLHTKMCVHTHTHKLTCTHSCSIMCLHKVDWRIPLQRCYHHEFLSFMMIFNI